MSATKDIDILRDLARKFVAVTSKPVQDERRALWRRHNSLKRTRPMVLCLWWCCLREIIQPRLECEDRFHRELETFFRWRLFQDFTDDDFVIEPWLTVAAAHRKPPQGLTPWGVPTPQVIRPEESGGAFRSIPPLQDEKDLEKMVKPRHEIDEDETRRRLERAHEAVGDLVDISLDRSPRYRNFSNTLGRLRGIEQLMWDMYDRPDWLHKLLTLMRDAVLEANNEAEAIGDYRLSNHSLIPMPYEETLEQPEANGKSVKRSALFAWFDAQEYAQVSPDMHWEFMLQYQLPIMEKFGLTHYGCCEDLTHKIDILRRVPNLRRIAVVPWADVAACAEQIRDDYVISWQPNPSEMGCCGFDPEKVRSIARDALDKMQGCHVDIVFKDVQTVEGHPERLREWSRIMRTVAEST